MKSFFQTLLIFLFFCSSIFSQTDKKWKFDLKQSSIQFYVKAKVENVKGNFGYLELTEIKSQDSPESLSGKFNVRIDSLYTKSKKRDTHLKSKDFFEASKYPISTIQIKEIIKNHSGYKTKNEPEFMANISIKIKNKTKNYSVPVSITMSEKKIKANGFFYINRREFGVNGNALTNIIVDNNVKLNFNIVLVSD